MMTFLIVLIVLSVAGIGFVLWMLKNDSESAEEPDSEEDLNDTEPATDNVETDGSLKEPPSPEQLNLEPELMLKLSAIKEEASKPKDKPAKPASSILGNALGKLKPPKKDVDEEIPKVTPLPNMKEFYGDGSGEKADMQSDQKSALSPEPKPVSGGETAQDTNLPEAEEKAIENEIELTSELSELKEKYDKLDSMFNQKSADFEKLKESLDHELKNRKEFNKVKDVLEKELKDSKDKIRDTQAQLNNTQSEIDSHKKRAAQLDEKASKLEKNLLQREDEVNELKQQAQAPAATPADNPVEPKPNAERPEAEHKPEPMPDPDKPQSTGEPPENAPEQPASADNKPAEGEAAEKPDDSDSQKPDSGGPEPEKDEKKGEEEGPKEDQFMKLKPDVLSTAPKEEEPKPVEDEKPEQTGGFTLDVNVEKDDKRKQEPDQKPPEPPPNNDVIM